MPDASATSRIFLDCFLEMPVDVYNKTYRFLKPEEYILVGFIDHHRLFS